MKKEIRISFQQASVPAEETPIPAFRCPTCMMADTCGRNCSHWESDGDGDGMGWCGVHGGWTDYAKWCCDWYYSH